MAPTTQSKLTASKSSQGQNRDLVPALLMAGPAIVLLVMFLIGPFFAGIGYSFTNQRLISANPTEWVGLRNYTRLVKMGILTVDPLLDEAGQPLLDETKSSTRNMRGCVSGSALISTANVSMCSPATRPFCAPC